MKRRLPNDRRAGVAAVEFAFCLPFLLLLIMGVWEVGRMVEVQQLLVNAVREGGRQASTGIRTTTNVKNYVVTYLNANGIPSAKASDVTVENLTDPSRSDPTTAEQMDHLRVTVVIPYSSIRWSLLNRMTTTQNLTASSDWHSMRDIPITVNDTIPIN